MRPDHLAERSSEGLETRLEPLEELTEQQGARDLLGWRAVTAEAVQVRLISGHREAATDRRGDLVEELAGIRRVGRAGGVVADAMEL